MNIAELVMRTEKRAEYADNRATSARARAAAALRHASLDRAKGYALTAATHLREAELHADSAARHDQTAQLQRLHVEHLRNDSPRWIGASARAYASISAAPAARPALTDSPIAARRAR